MKFGETCGFKGTSNTFTCLIFFEGKSYGEVCRENSHLITGMYSCSSYFNIIVWELNGVPLTFISNVLFQKINGVQRR